VASPNSDDLDLRIDLKAILKNQYAGQVFPDDQCRGWYRVLGKQGDCIAGMDDHTGEKVLSQFTLFYKNIFFTTYQPDYVSDPCYVQGIGRIYAVDYSYGTAVLNYFLDNDTSDEVYDVRDTYRTIQNTAIPSGVRVITRAGHAAGVMSAGGAIPGAGEGGGTTIPGPPGGVTPMLWRAY
jgi:Tfp pilus tip-associated adhesin PilY1